MLIQYSNLIGMPVASLSEQEKIGEVKEVVVDKKTLMILGILIKTSSSIFAKSKLLSQIDILDIDRNGVSAKNKECLINPEENIRVKRILDSNFKLINLDALVRTNNKKIGKISNFVIETNTFQVVRFYINNWGNERIFDHTNIYKITDKTIIFDDDIEKISNPVNIVQTANEK